MILSRLVFAQGDNNTFDIPSQALADSILLFSRQAELQVFYRTQLGAGLTTPAVVGKITPEQALQRLLQGSGLDFRFSDTHTVTLFRKIMADAFHETEQPIIDEIQVLGSYVNKRALSNYPWLAGHFNREDIVAQGHRGLVTISQSVPFSSSSELLVDNLALPSTAGTAAINLRNLGLGSTMILLNGHRQAPFAAATLQGEMFVDLNNLIPVVMIERVEVVSGGASATYGSDAVAGVVNITPRIDFDGLELNVEYQASDERGQTDSSVEILYGVSLAGDDIHWVNALSYQHQTSLLTQERNLSGGTVTPGVDQLGAYLTSSGLINDLGCGASGDKLGADSDFCLFDSTSYFDLSPEGNHWQWYSVLHWRSNEKTQGGIELGYSNADIMQQVSPMFPLPANSQWQTVENPRDIFLQSGLGAEIDNALSNSVHEYLHSTLTLDTEFDRWSLSSALGYASSQTRYHRLDKTNELLQDNSNDTSRSQRNPMHNFLYSPDKTEGESELYFADWYQHGKTQLITLDMMATSDWFHFEKSAYTLAAGAHYRRENITQSISQLPDVLPFLPYRDSSDYNAHRNVMAVYTELYWELENTLELQLAVRYENYEQSLDATAPKLSALWRFNTDTSLRASYSGAFKAPSLLQVGEVQSYPMVVMDPQIRCVQVYRNITTVGNDKLKLEPADVFGAGVSSQLGHDWQVNIDFWHYDYKNIILKESAHDILEREAQHNPKAIAKVTRGKRSGEILQINADFINAASIITSGLDFNISDQQMFAWGRVRTGATLTYVHRFDIKNLITGEVTNGVGRRNATTAAASSSPQWRANTYALWKQSPYQLRLVANYADSYKDDNNDKKIANHTTLDLHYQIDLGRWTKGMSLSAGLLNMFGHQPPSLKDSLGYDVRTHNTQGRSLYINFSYAL